MRISIDEIKSLAKEMIHILEKEGSVIKLETNDALIVGDTHGDIDTTLDALGTEAETYVFLGDYVDRGPYQIENIIELMRFKTQQPRKIILLRGNHETPSMNFGYGFYDIVSKRLGKGTYKIFAEVFAYLPLVAIINNKFLLMHGGIPEDITKIGEIENIRWPEEEVTDPVAFQILWNDPTYYVEEFSSSPRGVGARVFGRRALIRFLQNNDLEILIRAHEPVPKGCEYIFDNKLLTIFSCRYYGIEPCAARIINNTIKIQHL